MNLKEILRNAAYIILFVIILMAVGYWMQFYWTNCGFTPASEAPAICFAR